MGDSYLEFAEEIIKDVVDKPRGARVVGELIRRLTAEKQASHAQGRRAAFEEAAKECDLRAVCSIRLSGMTALDRLAAHCREQAAKLEESDAKS